MKYSKYPVQPFRLDDEPSEEKEEKTTNAIRAC